MNKSILITILVFLIPMVAFARADTFDIPNPSRQQIIPAVGTNDLVSTLGITIHPQDTDILDAATNAGLTWIRADLRWFWVETNTLGVYVWDWHDNLNALLQARGLKALWLLNNGNPLYGTGGSRPTNAFQVAGYGDFCQAAAAHFAGTGARYEIMNEPNIADFWYPSPNVTQYAAVAIEGIRRVHQGDSNALVTTGGMAGMDPGFIGQYLALGAGPGANGIGEHPYLLTPEDIFTQLPPLQSLISQYLTNVPVWNTECGYSTASYGGDELASARTRQAVMLARELLCCCAVGFPMSILYNLRDSTNGGENYGLVDTTNGYKPSMFAVKTLTSVARGRQYGGMIPTPTNCYALRFDGLGTSVLALWYAGLGSQDYTVSTNATVVDVLGTNISLSAVNGRLAGTLLETNGPVYIYFPFPPLLRATLSRGALSITWPSSATDFQLQCNIDLATTVWVDVTNSVSITGELNQVTISTTNGQAFYRLKSQ
jgi:hypothetical protein